MDSCSAVQAIVFPDLRPPDVVGPVPAQGFLQVLGCRQRVRLQIYYDRTVVSSGSRLLPVLVTLTSLGPSWRQEWRRGPSSHRDSAHPLFDVEAPGLVKPGSGGQDDPVVRLSEVGAMGQGQKVSLWPLPDDHALVLSALELLEQGRASLTPPRFGAGLLLHGGFQVLLVRVRRDPVPQVVPAESVPYEP